MGAILARVPGMHGTSLDVWHFICDDTDGTWTWRKMSSDGEQIAASDFSFKSFNVCAADAERAGYLSHVTPYRRIRSSELGTLERSARRRRGVERRRGAIARPARSVRR